MKAHEPRVQVEEVSSVLTPAPGVSVEQALADANISGADKIEIEGGNIVVTWYRRRKA